MSYDSEKIKNLMGEKSKKLAELGSILAKNQFTYKIQEKTTKEYWGKRILELKKYDETSLAYYNEIQNITKNLQLGLMQSMATNYLLSSVFYIFPM